MKVTEQMMLSVDCKELIAFQSKMLDVSHIFLPQGVAGCVMLLWVWQKALLSASQLEVLST